MNWKEELKKLLELLYKNGGMEFKGDKYLLLNVVDGAMDVFISSLLKKQREICAETLRQYIIQYGYSPVVFREIKSAPEPEDLWTD